MREDDARRHLAALRAEVVKRRAEQRLYAFLLLVWQILEPNTPFTPNWHIELLCEYLEAVTAGEIRRLVINIPPRYGKSLLCSVVWPVWEWIRQPGLRMICCSYGESLASRHALDRRRLLRDPGLLACWPQLRLTSDQHAKLEYHNLHRGVMIGTSVGGSITGKGGNRLIIDDPHNPTQASSDALRQHALTFYTGTLSTRLDDKARDRILLVMQRLHTDDMTALCLRQGFAHLRLPAVESADREIRFPRSGRIVHRSASQPLWPARENAAQLTEMAEQLGSYGYAAQYLQDPVPLSGSMFNRDWWQFYDETPAIEQMNLVLQSWDLSFKGTEGCDPIAGFVAGRIGPDIYLLDHYHARTGFSETLRVITARVARFPRSCPILIEDAANGPAIIDVLTREVAGVCAVSPAGGKEARASAVQPLVESGHVWLPRPRDPAGRPIPGREWVEPFIETCARFPKVSHDDEVDALTQLLIWAQAHPVLEPTGVFGPPPPSMSDQLTIMGYPRCALRASRGRVWNSGGDSP